MAEQNLKSLFATAERQRAEVESAWDRSSFEYQDNTAAAIATYDKCGALAESLSLFSPNELLEDIATGDLQYLLINYRLGDLFTRVANGDRRSILEKARIAYDHFLSLLSHYGILSSAENMLYDAYNEQPLNFTTISSSDFAARREAKIANFRKETELKKRLEFLAQHPAYIERDDDAVRELQLANISLCTHYTFQALETINREVEVLAMAPLTQTPGTEVLEHDYRERNGIRGGEEFSDRLDQSIPELLSSGNAGPMLSKTGKPLRPFTILDSRQRLQAGVFRSGHNLPTMTIDEYLEEERRRGGIIEGGGEASGVLPVPDEDNYAKGEEETLKAREWDEYVEANPKGSGNTLNRG